MLVKTIAHAELVFKHWRSVWRIARPELRWIVIDTETKAKPGFPPDDALVINRADLLIWSACYMGTSYSFPTQHLRAEYPMDFAWASFLRELFLDRSILKVFHNANYDVNLFASLGVPIPKPWWCTMIGAWKAEAAYSKGLKERMLRFGRVLQKTSSVDFNIVGDIAAYAEEDVIATDELMQMQRIGSIQRPRIVYHYTSSGKVVKSQPLLPSGRVVIEDEDLDDQEVWELKLQEFPYLSATIRAERRGFPFSVARAHTLRAKLDGDRFKVLQQIGHYAKQQINLNSTKQLIALFTELGIDIPDKTAKGAPSLKAKTLLKMKGSHPIVELLSKYRQIQKMASVYIGEPNAKSSDERGLEHFVTNGRIHALVNTVGAITGRTTCQKPNLTQIPSAKDTYGVKACFYAG